MSGDRIHQRLLEARLAQARALQVEPLPGERGVDRQARLAGTQASQALRGAPALDAPPGETALGAENELKAKAAIGGLGAAAALPFAAPLAARAAVPVAGGLAGHEIARQTGALDPWLGALAGMFLGRRGKK